MSDEQKPQEEHVDEPVEQAPAEPKMFEESYVKSLREENKKRRVENADLMDRLKSLEEKAKTEEEEKAKEEGRFKELFEKTQKELEDLTVSHRKSSIMNALKLEAHKAGIKDLDALRMIPEDSLNSIEVEGSEVSGVDKVIKDLVDSKPYVVSGEEEKVTVTGAPRANTKSDNKDHYTDKDLTNADGQFDWDYYQKNRDSIQKAMKDGKIV